MKNHHTLMSVAVGCALVAPACAGDHTGDLSRPITGEQRAVEATADTYLRQGRPNKNFGAETVVQLKASGKNRALIAFDRAVVADAVGSDDLVSATLELTIEHTWSNWGPGRTVDAHRLTQAWSESGATWRCADDADTGNHMADCSGPTDWNMVSSPPWVATASDTRTITSGQTGVVAFDVTADVVDMLAGGDDFGWIVKKTHEGQPGRVQFASRESAAAPRLVIDVELACDSGDPPEVLYSGQDRAKHVKLRDGVLYWATSDGIASGPAGGGTASVLATGSSGLLSITDSHVYWASEALDQALRVAIGGGATETVASATSNLHNVHVDDTHVYWTAQGSNAGAGTSEIWRAPVGGGSPELFDSGLEGAWGITGDATHVYYTTYYGGKLYRQPRAGGARETLASVGGNATHVTLDDTGAYFMTVASCCQNPGPARVMRASKVPGAEPLIVYQDHGSTGAVQPFGLAVDGSHVYWSVIQGDVLRADLGGGGPVEVVASGTATFEPAVDDRYVYWTDRDEDTVMRACK